MQTCRKCIFSTWGNSRVQLFLSTSWCISSYHEWPNATSDREMHQRVLRKSQTRELPHVEKAFSNVAINKLVNLKITWKLKNFPCKIEKFVKSQCSKSQMTRRKSLNGRSVFNIHATSSGPARGANEFGCHF